MTRLPLPIGPRLIVVFAAIWMLISVVWDGGPSWEALITGAVAGLFYALITTFSYAWQHSNGGRQAMRTRPPRSGEARRVAPRQPIAERPVRSPIAERASDASRRTS
ncbi:MAG: hypothetical protein AAGA48_05750 [Myxococcota bacterium]